MCFTFLPLPIVALHNLQITLVVSVGLIVKCSQIALVLLRFSAESVASFTDNSLLSHELVAVCLSNQGKTEGEGKGGHRSKRASERGMERVEKKNGAIKCVCV